MTAKNIFFLLFAICCTYFGVLVNAAQSQGDTKPVVIRGSTTVTNFIIRENKDKVREDTGVNFDLFVTSSGRGLRALAQEEADIAMISSRLENVINKLNKEGLGLKNEDFVLHPLSVQKVNFIVHESSPIETLTGEQVKDIFIGNVKNWQELGHDLGPIKIITEHSTGGIFRTVVKQLLNGQEITEDRITMQNAPQVALVVSQLPNAFGFLSAATPKEQYRTAKIIEVPDLNIEQSLYLVTRKGKTNAQIISLIDTIMQLAEEKNKAQ